MSSVLLDRNNDIRQSIADILTTPIGSRVMRREYGSFIPELIDAPANPAGIMRLIAATADALDKWEPRFRLDHMTVNPSMSGGVNLTVAGTVIADGSPAEFDITTLPAAGNA